MSRTPNLPHALDAGLRLCFIRAPLARASDAHRYPSSHRLSMFAKILEKLTGKDDLERVAYKEDLGLLNDYLKTRRLFFPKKPRRFLDAATFTQEQLLEMIEQETARAAR